MRWPWQRRRRILALLAFRDEMRYLPGYFANVAPQVDGVVALDDGSTDGSGEWVARRLEVLTLLRRESVEPHVWNDARNHRELVEASWQHEPDWLLGLDADERLERRFRRRAEAAIDGAERAGIRAFRVRVRELWDHPLHYRADGIWGSKSSPRLFAARRDHEFHELPLHCFWAPLNSRVDGDYPLADLELYHLRMLHAADRARRQARYKSLDPDRRCQAIGYGYMTDESGLRLERVPWRRRYLPSSAS